MTKAACSSSSGGFVSDLRQEQAQAVSFLGLRSGSRCTEQLGGPHRIMTWVREKKAFGFLKFRLRTLHSWSTDGAKSP